MLYLSHKAIETRATTPRGQTDISTPAVAVPSCGSHAVHIPLAVLARHFGRPFTPLWLVFCFGVIYISPKENPLYLIFLWTQGLEKNAPHSSSLMRSYHTNLQTFPDAYTSRKEDRLDIFFYRHKTRKKSVTAKDVRQAP
jgi:hypothetical protein